MIFDGELVAKLVVDYQNTRDPALLDTIMEESQSLVEAIVSGFNWKHRDDLIQESFLKLQTAIEYYDEDKYKTSNIHNFFTTVIRNCCLSYISKQDKYPDLQINLDISGEIDVSPPAFDLEEVISDLIIRNRKRFPSIPVDTIDGMSEYIVWSLYNKGITRRSVTKIKDTYGCARSIVNVIYNSSIVYLRMKYSGFGNIPDDYDEEYTLLPEVCDLLGKEARDAVMLVFSGLSMKIP